MATKEQVRQTLEDYIRAWRDNDKALLLSLFAPDAILEDPVGTPPFTGHEGIGRFWDFAHMDKSRQIEPKLQEIRPAEGRGILSFTMEVRIPEQNKGLDLSIIEFVEFDEEGRIRHLRAFWDETSIRQPEGMDLFLPDVEDAYEPAS